MIKFILCAKETYSKQEKAKMILFGTASPKDFVPAFVFDGIEYYKKVK